MFVTFNPPEQPSYGLSKETQFDVTVARFGDGYSQRMRKGINSTKEVWNLTWEDIDRFNAVTIENFLLATGGADVFWWTPPPNYPVDLEAPVQALNGGLGIGGFGIGIRQYQLVGNPGPRLVRCTKLSRVYSSPLNDTVTATFEQEFDLGS